MKRDQDHSIRLEDLKDLMLKLVPHMDYSLNARLGDFLEDMPDEAPAGEEFWQCCRKCGEWKPAKEYYDNTRTPYGKDYKCKHCSNAVNNRNRRRKRLSNKMLPEDLAEIQRVRELRGLKPLPLGAWMPKPGRPKAPADDAETSQPPEPKNEQ